MDIIKGGNGNVEIDRIRQTATKRFRNNSSPDKIFRFKREILLMKELSDKNLPNLVKIIDVNCDENNFSNSFIKMELYDGTLYDLVDLTKGNVRFSFQLIKPIVQLLKELSERSPAVYHRDLKPDNILYKKKPDGSIELYLTDFGLCYLKDDSERLTPDEIAVGARKFMAPEYEVGKVEEVTEKGDIYSLGKILWYIINGNLVEFLPYNLWFVDTYNLQHIFSNDNKMLWANIIISSCLSIEPQNRCTYDELIDLINNAIIDVNITPIKEKQLLVKVSEEKRQLEWAESLQKNKLLVNSFSCIYISALKKINEIYPNIPLLQKLLNDYVKKSSDGINFCSISVENNSAHYLYSTSFDNIYISINYNPAHGSNNYANIDISYSIFKNSLRKTLVFCYEQSNIVCKEEDLIFDFNANTIVQFLEEMILNYFS